MNRQIEALIDKYADEGDFTRVPLTGEDIELVKRKLGLGLPQQYLDYLNTYSSGGFNFEILGKGYTGSLLFLEETLSYRKDGLPHNLVVVENCDEWLYCIDCDTGKMVSWSQLDGVRPEYDSFDDYLLDRLHDAIENL